MLSKTLHFPFSILHSPLFIFHCFKGFRLGFAVSVVENVSVVREFGVLSFQNRPLIQVTYQSRRDDMIIANA